MIKVIELIINEKPLQRNVAVQQIKFGKLLSKKQLADDAHNPGIFVVRNDVVKIGQIRN